MESAVAGLLVGTVGVGLSFWCSRALSRRYAGRSSQAAPAAPRTQAEVLRDTGQVYKSVLYLRLSGMVLCVVAGVLLYLRAGMLVSMLFAGAGCLLQLGAYLIRTRHVLSVTEAPRDVASAEMRAGEAQRKAASEVNVS